MSKNAGRGNEIYRSLTVDTGNSIGGHAVGTSKTIDYRIDLLKCIAVARVITVHTSAYGFASPVASMNWLSGLFWGSLARGSVPIFLMCSGALLLDPEYGFDIRRFYTKNMVRIVAALFFWAAVYKIFRLSIAGGLTAANLAAAFKDLLLFRHEGHLYYLHVILLVYALLPITRLFVRYADDRLMVYALALWYVLGIVYPTVRPFWPFSLLSGIPAQWMLNMTYSAVGYTLLGYRLKKRGPVKRQLYWVFVVIGFLAIFIVTYTMSVRNGSLYTHFFEGMTVPVSLLAIGIYGIGICAAPVRSGKWKKRLRFGSKASFCVYLAHIIVLDLLFVYFKNIELSYFLLIPVLVVLNGLLCCVIYAILNKIPFCRKYLI